MKKNIISLKSYKKIPARDQAYLLKVISELLAEGFSIKQGIEFIIVLLPKYEHLLKKVIDSLEEGQPLERGLKEIGYSISIVSQVFYGQRQGRFIESLNEISQQMDLEYQQRKKFLKVLTYPCFLLLFLGGMLIALRTFILPHIVSFISPKVFDENIWVRILLNFFIYLPQIFLGALALIMVAVGGVDLFLMKQSAVERYQFLGKLPVIGRWSKYLATYKFMNQLGYFFRGGYSIQQIIHLLIEYPIDPFMSGVGHILQEQLMQGEELGQIVNNLKIFTEELPLIIYQGELTSQMARKCKIFAEKVYQQLIEDIERKITLVQPILFIFIALIVVSIYMIMMLPMLTMEGL